MDSPDLDGARHRRALRALRRINRWSRSAPQLWAEIEPVARRLRGRPLRIADLACGGGDVAASLDAIARRRGFAVDVRGYDASPLAVAHAGEHARATGSRATFTRLDVLREPLPSDADVVCSTLFLHHLDELQAVALLRRMGSAAGRLVLVQDLERSRSGYALAWLAVRTLTRSDVARVDGPRSVRGAFTAAEALGLARRAGFDARVRRCWPQRYMLGWERT